MLWSLVHGWMGCGAGGGGGGDSVYDSQVGKVIMVCSPAVMLDGLERRGEEAAEELAVGCG